MKVKEDDYRFYLFRSYYDIALVKATHAEEAWKLLEAVKMIIGIYCHYVYCKHIWNHFALTKSYKRRDKKFPARVSYRSRYSFDIFQSEGVNYVYLYTNWRKKNREVSQAYSISTKSGCITKLKATKEL
jgi:hypothetical protein